MWGGKGRLASRWRVVLLVAAFLVASPTTAAWTQMRGSADRVGTAPSLPAVLDVLDTRVIPGPSSEIGFVTGPGWVETSRGMATVVQASQRDACLIVFVPDVTTWSETQHVLENCRNGHVVAYNAVLDFLYICSEGSPKDAVLRALRSADLSEAWSTAPSELYTDPAERQDATWDCRAGALEPEEAALAIAYVGLEPPSGGIVNHPATSTTLHRIVVHDAERGAVRAKFTVPDDVFAGSSLNRELLRPSAEDDAPPASSFKVTGMALTSTTVFLSGELNLDSKAGNTPRMAVAWVDRVTGTVHGTQVASSPPPGLGPASGASNPGAAAQGMRVGSRAPAVFRERATVALGDQLVVLAGSSPTPEFRPLEDVLDADAFTLRLAPPIWHESLIAVPMLHAVAGFRDSDDSAPFSFSITSDWFVEDVLITTGRVLVLYSSSADENSRALRLVQYGIQTGIELQATPIRVPLGAREALGDIARLVPTTQEQLLIVDRFGAVARVGAFHGTANWTLAASDLFPPMGKAVTLDVGVIEEMRGEVFVNWGDGASETYGPAEGPSHEYASEARFPVLVTVAHPDGTTSTQQVFLEVGGTPPASLNFMQRALESENQDVTFFVLGLILTLIGAAFALTRRSRRRYRLSTRIAVLEIIRRDGQRDPARAIEELERYRRRLSSELANGRLDDGMFGVLELRMGRLMRGLSHRLLAPFEGRLAPSFRRQLEGSLEDGLVDRVEAAALLKELGAQDGLSASERSALRRVIRGWAAIA